MKAQYPYLIYVKFHLVFIPNHWLLPVCSKVKEWFCLHQKAILHFFWCFSFKLKAEKCVVQTQETDFWVIDA